MEEEETCRCDSCTEASPSSENADPGALLLCPFALSGRIDIAVHKTGNAAENAAQEIYARKGHAEHGVAADEIDAVPHVRKARQRDAQHKSERGGIKAVGRMGAKASLVLSGSSVMTAPPSARPNASHENVRSPRSRSRYKTLQSKAIAAAIKSTRFLFFISLALLFCIGFPKKDGECAKRQHADDRTSCHGGRLPPDRKSVV